MRFSYDSTRARGRPRLCRRRRRRHRLLVYAHQTHATRKSVPFHQAAAERVMAADNKRSTFPFFRERHRAPVKKSTHRARALLPSA